MSRRVREAVLWIGAVLGAFCLVWTAVMFAFGLTPLVFTSGSMEPAIAAGDLAFATTVPAKELSRGDVVSVINDRGTRITHRVTRVDRQDDGDAILELKGDANASPDQQAYRVFEVERVSFAVPKAGYVINLVGSPNGMFVGGLAVAGLLYLGFRRDDEDAPERSSGSSGPAVRAVAVVGTVITVGLLPTTGAPESTAAAFSDTAQVTSGAVGAAALPVRPASISCSEPLFSTSAVVSWSDDDSRHGYYYEIDNDASFASPEERGTVQPTGSNSFTMNSSSAGGWFSSTTYYFRVYSTFVDATGARTWTSASYRAFRVARSIFSNNFTCEGGISPVN